MDTENKTNEAQAASAPEANTRNVPFKTDGLYDSEIEVLSRIDWTAVKKEIGLDPETLSENVLHQLARGSITDFVYAFPVKGEATVSYESNQIALQIPSRALAGEAREKKEPIRMMVHFPRMNPQTHVTKDLALSEKMMSYLMEKRVSYKYKKDENGELIYDEKGNPVFDLDANGNVVVLGERYLNRNAGEPITVVGQDKVQRQYIIAIDHEVRTANGYAYRGTNKIVAISVDSVAAHLEAILAKRPEINGHILTASEVRDLVNSRTVVANDFVNSNGETYIAGLQYDPVTRNIEKVYNGDVANYRMQLARIESREKKAQAAQAAEPVQAPQKPAKAQPKAQEPKKSSVKRS